jgi:ferredoxin
MVIDRAKKHALANDIGAIEFELNRVVKRYHVNVEVEDDNGKITLIEDVLAGDNLRLLLLKHKANLYDGSVPRLDQPFLTGDCGGQGICGTCLVHVLKGMDHLNSPSSPQEQSILKGRPSQWRAACKTVIGADNVPGTTLRVRLHPHQYQEPLEDAFLRP